MSKKALKICMVSPVYHLSLGGLGRQAQLLTEKLADAGTKVFVITRKMQGSSVSSYSPRVKIIRVWTPWPSVSALEKVNFQSILISLIFSVGCAWALLKKKRSYDLVHFHGARAALFFNLPILNLLGKKVVTKVSCANHAMEVGSLKGNYWPLGNILARLVRAVDLFIAISNEIHKGLLKDEIKKERILRIPNCIEMGVFCAMESGQKEKLKETMGLKNKLVVTCCGRLVPRKGVQFLLMAWQEIAKEQNDAVLLIVGDGPLRNELEKIADKLKIRNSTHFLGWQDNATDFLGITDIFVLPSLQEGLSNSLLEAMASGLPIVATRISGTEDVIQDGENGVLVEPEDWKGLASKVLWLFADRPKALSLGQKALDTIERDYNIEKVHKKYLEIYRKLCEKT